MHFFLQALHKYWSSHCPADRLADTNVYGHEDFSECLVFFLSPNSGNLPARVLATIGHTPKKVILSNCGSSPLLRSPFCKPIWEPFFPSKRLRPTTRHLLRTLLRTFCKALLQSSREPVSHKPSGKRSWPNARWPPQYRAMPFRE